MLEAVKSYGHASGCAAQALQGDPYFVLVGVEAMSAWLSLHECCRTLKGDGASVLEAVEQVGNALYLAAVARKGDGDCMPSLLPRRRHAGRFTTPLAPCRQTMLPCSCGSEPHQLARSLLIAVSFSAFGARVCPSMPLERGVPGGKNL